MKRIAVVEDEVYTREELYELALVLFLKQLSHHAEHALYALAERVDFLLCLKH